MREVFAEAWHYVLVEDESTHAFYIQALCNQSAAYFFVEARLLPSEEALCQVNSRGELSAEARATLGDLADKAQWSPKSFAALRDELWKELGLPGAPAVPDLAR